MKPALRPPLEETLCMLDIMLIYHKKDKHVNVLRPPLGGEGRGVARGCTRLQAPMILYVAEINERKL